MANVLNLINLVVCFVLLNSADSATEIEELVKTSLKDFYWTKYFKFPFLVNIVAKFSEEADAVIQISDGLYTGNADKGLTMALLPYRQQINKVLAAFEGTGASQCAGYYKLTNVDVYSSLSSTGYNVTQTPLYTTSRTIANAYASQYSACAKGVTDNLRTRISTLNTLVDNLKSEIIDRGESIIRGCGASSSLENAQECTTNFSDEVRNIERQFVNVFNSYAKDNEDKYTAYEVHLYDKVLFSIPNCLLYSYIDAIGSANTILRTIQECANTAGVNVSINQTSVTKSTQNLQTVYNLLGPYYNLSRLSLSKEYEILIASVNYLSYQIDQAKEALTRNTTVESVLNANVKAKSALKIAAESTNITLKTCVYQSFTHIRADIAKQITSFRTCALASLNYATSLQSYINAAYSRIFDPLKPGPVSQIPDCIVSNIFNTTTLGQCTSEIYNRLDNENNYVSSEYRTIAAESEAAYNDTSKFVNSCNSTVSLQLTGVYQCDGTLFRFLAV